MFFVYVFGLGTEVAAVLGVNVSAIISYFGHGLFTFSVTMNHKIMMPKFIGSIFFAYIVSYLTSIILKAMEVPPYLIFAIVVVMVASVNYVIFQVIIFRD